MYFNPYFDSTMLIVLPAFLFSLWAQFKVKGTFDKYSRVNSRSGMTAAQAARSILDKGGLSNIPIESVRGHLTDHYDPSKKVIRLSESVYNSSSLASIGVAAHEAGHAVQHSKAFFPMILRGTLVPLANIGSNAGPWLAIIGIVLGWAGLAYVGIALFMLAVLFYLVTLPVEFDASKRAVASLEQYNILGKEELLPVKKVLSAAGMTYLAAAAVSFSSLLRLLLLVRRSDD